MMYKRVLKCFVALCVMLAVFTLSIIAVHCIPRTAVEKNVLSSAKLMQEEGLYKEFFNFKLFQMDNFTDCYMLNLMASADAEHPVEAAMLNYDYKSDNFMDLAYDTEKVATGNTKDLNCESYGRYWHGYQVTLKPLLTVMDYSGLRIFNYFVFAALLVICSVLMWRKIGKGVSLLFLTSLLLINFPIVPLSFQFSTCFLIALVGMIAFLKYPSLRKNDDNLYCAFFVLGGVTSFMDFLTTPQLTLGLPMLVCLLMSKKDKKWKYVIAICVAWALGYGLVWASKWLIGYLLTGTNILADAMESAKLRTSDSYKGMHMTIVGILTFIWDAIVSRHLQIPFFAAICVVIALVAVYVKFIKSKAVFQNYAYLLLVALIVPAWFLVMRNHSIQHGWFTWRAGLLTLYSLLLLVYYTVDWHHIVKKQNR